MGDLCAPIPICKGGGAKGSGERGGKLEVQLLKVVHDSETVRSCCRLLGSRRFRDSILDLQKEGCPLGESEQSDQLCSLHRKLWRGKTGERDHHLGVELKKKKNAIKREAGWPRTPDPIKSFVRVGGGGSWNRRKRQKNFQAETSVHSVEVLKGEGGALGSAFLTGHVANPLSYGEEHQPEKRDVGEGVAAHASVGM